MGFKIEEATIEEIQLAFRSNELTSKQLVEYYLNAIARLNPTLKAVIEVNPDALILAELADCIRNQPTPLGYCECSCNGMMHGIPVLLKDNIASKDKLKTTSGSTALVDSVVPRDAAVVERLKSAGAIILGKAGLTQWANFRSQEGSERMPDGWSSRGGGAVKNPYVLDTDPGGSSTGSAVSVAVNLTTVSLGTETSRSIIEPCSLSSVVGIKPTVGLTGRSGVIPISLRQDTVGPIGRTVSDAVHLLDAIVGFDPRDEITKDFCRQIPSAGYKQFLKAEGLKGKRLGNLWHLFKDILYEPGSPIITVFEQHFSLMSQHGAVLLNDLDMPKFMTIMNPDESGEFMALKYEFKRDLNAYLSNLLESPVRSLAEVIAYNERCSDVEKIKEYGQKIFIDSEATTLPSSEYTQKISDLAKLSEECIEKFMKDNNLDAIMTPEHLGANMLASGGYPGIIVPAGFDPDGVPYGIMFGGLKGSEATLIEISYAFEQLTKVRKPPTVAA